MTTTNELREQIGDVRFAPFGSRVEIDIADAITVEAMDEVMRIVQRIALEARKKDLDDLFNISTYKAYELGATIIEKLKDVESQLQELDNSIGEDNG